ncbi:MAG: hypothetical protein ABSB35_24840 [Bryobacteraceae bacterium]|jgi:hypothetical protein
MASFVDDAARILASPGSSRRSAVKALGRVFAGAMLAGLGIRTANALALCGSPGGTYCAQPGTICCIGKCIVCAGGICSNGRCYVTPS